MHKSSALYVVVTPLILTHRHVATILQADEQIEAEKSAQLSNKGYVTSQSACNFVGDLNESSGLACGCKQKTCASATLRTKIADTTHMRPCKLRTSRLNNSLPAACCAGEWKCRLRAQTMELVLVNCRRCPGPILTSALPSCYYMA